MGKPKEGVTPGPDTFVSSVVGSVAKCDGARLWNFMLGDSFPITSVGAFADGTLAYVFSFMWHDLLTAHIFGLRVPPFCAPDGIEDCKPSGSGPFYTYAMVLIFVVACTKWAFAQPWAAKLPGVKTLPSMLGMLCGWGIGDATVVLIGELRDGAWSNYCLAPPFEGMPPDCNILNITVAFLFSAFAAVVIVILRPYAEEIEFGDGAWVDFLEEWLEAFWDLLGRALGTAVMKIWSSVFTIWLYTSLEQDADHASIIHRVDLLWAIGTTCVGSLASVKLEQWEGGLARSLYSKDAATVAKVKTQERAARSVQKAYREAKGHGDLTSSKTYKAPTATEEKPTEKPASGVATANIAKEGKSFAVHQVKAMIELSNLMQGVMGWVAGCAWVAVVIDLAPSFGASSETWGIFLSNFAITTGLTFLALLWLMASGDDPNATPWNETLKREDVEQYFITGAASFCVGWGWILISRDIYHPWSVLFSNSLTSFYSNTFGLALGAPDALIFHHTTNVLAVCIYAPLVTYAFFAAKDSLSAAYARAIQLQTGVARRLSLGMSKKPGLSLSSSKSAKTAPLDEKPLLEDDSAKALSRKVSAALPAPGADELKA